MTTTLNICSVTKTLKINFNKRDTTSEFDKYILQQRLSMTMSADKNNNV